jgi:hypothetical protein
MVQLHNGSGDVLAQARYRKGGMSGGVHPVELVKNTEPLGLWNSDAVVRTSNSACARRR